MEFVNILMTQNSVRELQSYVKATNSLSVPTFFLAMPTYFYFVEILLETKKSSFIGNSYIHNRLGKKEKEVAVGMFVNTLPVFNLENINLFEDLLSLELTQSFHLIRKTNVRAIL
jgi:hypothetical protein